VTGPRLHRIRLWLQTELGEDVRAGISEDEFRRARQFLESEDTQVFFAERDPDDHRSEGQILNDMKVLAIVVRRSLKPADVTAIRPVVRPIDGHTWVAGLQYLDQRGVRISTRPVLDGLTEAADNAIALTRTKMK
jgi:hypothetical protein